MPSGYLAGAYLKGKVINNGTTTVAAGGTVQADLDTAGWNTLIVMFRIGNGTTPATASTDLSNPAVVPYEDDGVTLWNGGTVNNNGMSPDLTVRSATLTSNVAYVAFRYSVVGIDKVRVAITNNNVAALQGATAIYYLSRF